MNKQLTLDLFNNNNELLPVINKVVKATIKIKRKWPICLGGNKVSYKILLVKRIKSSSNSKGWQWSGTETETYINAEVVRWKYI